MLATFVIARSLYLHANRKRDAMVNVRVLDYPDLSELKVKRCDFLRAYKSSKNMIHGGIKIVKKDAKDK